MPKIAYIDKSFQSASLEKIEWANEIIEEYEIQGYDLTLRQLYYQMVARGYIPNTMRSYKNLGSVIDDARLAGMIDWDRIVDRTRNLRSLSHWSTPAGIISSAAYSYRIDRWANQKNRVEVWIEKDALVGVISQVCEDFDVPYFACRGYTSQSEMWRAAQRLKEYRKRGQQPVILHLGDHDPSGIDMTRDIIDRLTMFSGGIELQRLALNYDQVVQYNPPPNPAKTTDSRSDGYIAQFGRSSWELDALSPTVIGGIITGAIEGFIEPSRWNDDDEIEKRGIELLNQAASNWRNIEEFLDRLSN